MPSIPDGDEIRAIVETIVQARIDPVLLALDEIALQRERPMTREQTAEYLQVHPATIGRMTRDGRIPCVHLTNAEKRWYRSDIDQALKNPGCQPDEISRHRRIS